MAYRKTETVLADIASRKKTIVTACVRIIAKHGMERLTTAAVAERAMCAEGLIYKYFADKTELVAAVVAKVLADDHEMIKASDLPETIGILYRRVAESPRLMAVIGATPVYREGIKKELQRMIRDAGVQNAPLFAAAVFGAVFEAAGSRGPREAAALTSALLKGMGLRSTVTA